MTTRLIIIAMIIMAFMTTPAIAKANEPCDGFVTIDGCVTIDVYNTWFSFDNLSHTESLTFPGQSVADVYELVDDGIMAVDRPRVFMDETLPTIRWIIEHNRGI